MKRLVTTVLFLFFMAKGAIAEPVTPGNLLVSSNHKITEYTMDGAPVQNLPTVYPGGYPATEYARDLVSSKAGKIYLFNGTFYPYMSTFDSKTSVWSHLNYPGFSTVNNISYGGIGLYETTVFATDMFTYSGGEAQGIVAFNTITGQGLRFGGGDPIDLTMGLDGLLYSLSPGGSPEGRTISVYNPADLSNIRNIDLTNIFGWTGHRAIAVDYNGDIFVADWDGDIQRIDKDGNLLGSIDINQTICDIDISLDGELAVGTWFGQVYLTDIAFSKTTSFSSSGSFVNFVPTAVPVAKISTSPSTPDGLSGWFKSVPLITITADETATIFYSWDTTSPSTTYAGPLQPTADGTRDLYYQAVSPERTGRQKKMTFKIDTNPPTPPTVSSTQDNSGWSIDQRIKASLADATDLVSGVDGHSFTWSYGAPETPDNTIDIEANQSQVVSDLLSDGAWYFNIKTRDKAGNWSATVHEGPLYITEPFQLTAGATDEYEPVFAGNDMILYERYDPNTDQSDIWAMDREGQGKTNLTNTTDRHETHPDYSAQKDKVVFSSYDADWSTSDIWLMDLDGSNKTNLTSSFAGEKYAPRFSPDGEKIVFTYWDPNDLTNDIYLMNFDGSGRKNLTKTPGRHEFDPVFGPGGKIVYAMFSANYYSDIWTMDQEGAGQSNLTKTPDIDEYGPSFSATSNRIAYTLLNADGEADIWWMDGSGENKLVLTASPSRDESNASFSPDGKNVVFQAWDYDKGASDLWLLHDEGPPTPPRLSASSPSVDQALATDTVAVVIVPSRDERSGLGGYSYSWTRDTTEDVGPAINAAASRTLFVKEQADDGKWYLNLRAVDNFGNWTKTTHMGPLMTDTGKPTDPTVTVASHDINVWSAKKRINVEIGPDAADTGSGVAGYAVSFSKDATGLPARAININDTSGTTDTYSSSVLGDGIWYVNVATADHAGNWTSTVHLGPYKIDSTQPTASMNSPFISTKVSKTTAFKVKWAGADAGVSSGIKDYTIRYRSSTSGSWRTWKENTTATEGLFAGQAGVTYYFRAKVEDNAGNAGWSRTEKTIVPFGEGIYYSKVGFNGYRESAVSQSYLSSVRYSYVGGHSLTYKLANINSIGLVVTKGPDMGRAKIYIDGNFVGTVDARSSSNQARQLIFFRSFPTSGPHELKVVNLGTRGRPKFEVDAVAAGR